MNRPTLIVTTSSLPGAVALLQLHGQGSRNLVRKLTGRDRFDDHKLYLTPLADIDEGLCVCRGDDWAQISCHGGPRVVRKLADQLLQWGAIPEENLSPRDLYPEAKSDLEADMLAALAMSPSPAAIDLLLAQPRLWRRHVRHPRSDFPGVCHFDHLLHPPAIVVAGPVNVGKSTLSNAILGRQSSLVSDLPGATRDWVGSLTLIADIAVHWIDTPGRRKSDDPIECQAIALSQQVIDHADVLILMRDPQSDYPSLPRADIRIINKVDDAKADEADELPISALRGCNLDLLQQRILRVLGLDDIAPDALWAFSDTLKRYAADPSVDLRQYVG